MVLMEVKRIDAQPTHKPFKTNQGWQAWFFAKVVFRFFGLLVRPSSTHTWQVQIEARNAKSKKDFWFRILKERSKTPLQYWRIEGDAFPLIQAVAIPVFCMVSSSAASERGFSTMGFIH